MPPTEKLAPLAPEAFTAKVIGAHPLLWQATQHPLVFVIPKLVIFFVSLEAILILTRLECRIHLGELRVRKHSLHGIIVAGWQRIKLVIMTPGTLQCVAKKHLPDRVGHII